MSADASGDCPLSHAEQTRNLLIYGINVGLIYLSAPVVYIGPTQASLISRLVKDARIANLPGSIYYLAAPLPVLVAWYLCSVRVLKPTLVGAYLLQATAGGVVTAALLLELPAAWVIGAVNLHAALLGLGNGVVWSFSWEVLGRGVAYSRRGQVLAFAYGAGPIFAALGSLAQQLILKGELGSLTITSISYPWNFALLYGATVPLLGLAGLLSTRFILPQPGFEPPRPAFFITVFGGLGDYFRNRLILLAAIAFVLVSSGYSVITNITLYTEKAVGEAPEKYVGYENALRFGFKAVVGLFLGWLLTRTNPKGGMLVTGGFCLASILWLLLLPTLGIPGIWFLLSFALMGAGELMGLYYPNYIFYCSPQSRMRRNMTFTNMLNALIFVAPVLFGAIADEYGFMASFRVGLAFVLAALLLVIVALPGRPQPRESDMDLSDRDS